MAPTAKPPAFSKTLIMAGKTSLICTAGLALALLSSAALAIDYRSVSRPGILFDAPSHGARPLFIVAPGTPVEVVVSSGEWVRVRDHTGSMNWMESNALSSQRTIIVTAERAAVRSEPSPGAAIVFEAARDVVLNLTSPPQAGWAPVRHRDGLSGYIFISEAWGL